ncbi:MAG: radical SAM protein [Pseudomonadales bacterium]
MDTTIPVKMPGTIDPPDFGSGGYPSALVTVTNACNLRCRHCFVYREGTPNSPRDRMNDAEMLRQLRVLRDRHGIRSMLFMGGEPMIRRDFLLEAMELFEQSSVVTNGTYGIPSVPGHLVTVSLDGPQPYNDALRGQGVFAKVRRSVFERDPEDGTVVMLQMTVTRENEEGIEAFVDTVADWPVDGIAFTFYVPSKGEQGPLAWRDLRERDAAVRKIIELKQRYPQIRASAGALELMLSHQALKFTGRGGEHCGLRQRLLPLYVGDGGRFERTFCCYGNDVDCSRCGAYAVFNSAYKQQVELEQIS